jgi:hypothetical protein
MTVVRTALAFLLSGLIAGCTEQPATPDAGDPAALVDSCDGAEAAAGEACRLTLGAEREGYISPQEDVDWYLLEVPEPLPARALLTVKVGYRAPSSPVTLVVNLLKADGRSSLGSATDPRPRGAPGTAQLVARLQPPNGPGAGRYFVVVSHDSGAEDPAADRKNPYFLSATLASDPDLNEPNDQTPTAVTLPACGAASAQGALSTEGDVDRFSFQLQPCAGRTLLYLSLDAPASSEAVRDRAPLDPAYSQASITFSSAVRVGTRLKSWKTKPISRARIRVRSPSPSSTMSRPSKLSSGRGPSSRSGAWRSPRMCIKVLLPEPDGPMIATISPGSMLKSTPRRACTSLCLPSL